MDSDGSYSDYDTSFSMSFSEQAESSKNRKKASKKLSKKSNKKASKKAAKKATKKASKKTSKKVTLNTGKKAAAAAADASTDGSTDALDDASDDSDAPSTDPLAFMDPALKFAKGSALLKKILEGPKYRVVTQGAAVVGDEVTGAAAATDAASDVGSEASDVSDDAGTDDADDEPSSESSTIVAQRAAIQAANADVEVTHLLPGDPVFEAVVAHFHASRAAQGLSAVEVETVLDVFSPAPQKAFDKYRAKIEKKRAVLARNNLVVRRLYHGTFLRCSLGLDDNFELCDHPDCRVCSVLRGGFDFSHAGECGRRLPDLAAHGYKPRFGRAHYFSENPLHAKQFSSCWPSLLGKAGRAAVLSCQVVVGQPQSLWFPELERKAASAGYDSVQGEPADIEHSTGTLTERELAVYADQAAIAAQLIVFKSRGDVLCLQCGVELFAEDAGAHVRNEYGAFCSALCATEFSNSVHAFQALLTETPVPDEDDDDASESAAVPAYWSQTTSDENCVLIDLVPSSREFAILSMMARKTLPALEIEHIFRIQNKMLLQRYVSDLRIVREKNGGSANEALLFHANAQMEPSEIYDADEAFDIRHSVLRTFGKGAYFSDSAAFMDQHAYVETSGLRMMFVGKVALGDVCDTVPDSTLRMPPEKPKPAGAKKGKFKRIRFDSVSGITNGTRLNVTYQNSRAYPGWLVCYRNAGSPPKAAAAAAADANEW